MPDVIHNQTQPPQPSDQPAPLTREEFDRALADRDTLWQSRMDAMNRDFEARVRQEKRGPGRPPKEAPTSESVQLMQEFEKKQADRAISQGLAANFEGLGVDNPGALSKYFRSNYEDRMSVDEEGVVQFTESNGKITPLKDYIQAWAQSKEGQTFVPARRGASGVPSSRSSAPLSSSTPYRSMDFEQLQERHRIDPRSVIAYMEAYPEEYNRKISEHARKLFR